ncbi:MAG: HAMP domain-containing histidine kinase [Deltaproteobacteria bacterium]|nr:HAMP domain-containing histidine kinase [Deltaproteobacteria bacterium]
MTLRQRLAVATIAATIPVAVLLLWFDAATHYEAGERFLVSVGGSRLAELQAACEADPAAFGGELEPHHHGPGPPRDGRGPRDGGPPERGGDGPRGDGPGGERPPRRERRPGGPDGPPPPPPRVWAYDASFAPTGAGAPPVPEGLREEALAGAAVATDAPLWPGEDVLVLLRGAGDAGRCRFFLLSGHTDPHHGGVLPSSLVWLLPTAAVFLAMLAAASPVVRRIRRLRDAVGASARSAYATPTGLAGKDEVGELAAAFDRAGEEVRARLADNARREQALREFLAHTMHDVMIPLTVLKGHLATLRDAAGEGDGKKAVVSAMDEAHYIASLLRDLAAAARLDAAVVELERGPVDLGGLVTRVVARHRPIARQLEVELESAIPREALVIDADETLLEQAVSNIVYNAVRYNKPGGHVAVICEAEEGARFRVTVLDDGPGIPEEELARLADRGYRRDEARTRAPDGQGLGLHIAQRAAALHGFALQLGASEYGGLEVRIAGPVARAEG